MKMKMAKRIVAIVLSVLMLVGALPMNALAETVADYWYQEMLEKAVLKYYERIMEAENVEEFDEVIYEVYLQQYLNIYKSLNGGQQQNMDAHAYALFKAFEDARDGVWEDTRVTIYPTKDVTSAAPFVEPVTGTSSMLRMMSRAAGDNNGLELSKTISVPEDAENGEYLLTLEAYATGSKVTSIVTEQIPTDIVLVLDQSGSMDSDFNVIDFKAVTGTPAQLYNKSTNLYVKVDGAYIPVTVSRSAANSASNYTAYSYQNNHTYWDYDNGLYHKCSNGGYGVLTITRTGNQNNRQYAYVCANCGPIETSQDWNTRPNCHNQIYVLSQTPIYNYIFTYTDDNGNTETQTVGASDNAPNWQFYESYTVDTISRLKALQNAATTFKNAVIEKAKGEDGVFGNNAEGVSDDVDHRIAVVGFSHYNNYNTYGNTEVFIGANQYAYGSAATAQYGNALQSMKTTTGQNNVTASIGALSANGGTYVDCGIEMANGILNANPVPAGTKRNRVVIIFTDGAPGWSGSYGNGDYGESGDAGPVANAAISKANTTKNTYGASVYTVGIFDGADASFPLPANEGNGRTNRFMHLMSSNYPNATSMSSTGNIKENLVGSYYLSASDSKALTDIFETISNNIESGGSATTLNSSTVIQDVLTDQFVLPEGTDPSQIKVYTANYTAANTFAARVEMENPSVTIGTVTQGEGEEAVDRTSVSVTNFNFSENWVGTDTATDGTVSYRGKKLIIEIPIKVKPGFLGGNNVITNADGSGVFADSDKAEADDPVEDFVSPSVNVAIHDQSIAVQDKNVYLLAEPTMEQLMAGSTIQMLDFYGDPVKDKEGNVITDPEQLTWQKAYVSVDLEKESQVSGGLTGDSSFEATLTIEANSEGTGDDANTEAKTATATGTIRVFKPELTFRDTDVKFGDLLTDVTGEDNYYGKKNYLSNMTVWKHGSTLSTKVSMMERKAPELTLAYVDQDVEWLDNDIRVDTLDCIPVNVTVAIGTNDVTQHSTSVRKKCACENIPDGHCDHTSQTTEASMGNDPEFIVHVYDVFGFVQFTKTLISEKEDNSDIPEFVDTEFVFTVKLTDKDGNALTGSYPVEISGDTKEYTVSNGGTITITGGQTATIKELPHESKYTISEVKPNGYVLELKKNGSETITSKIAAGSITASVTDCDKYVFTNTYTPAGLEIKKKIENNDSSIDKKNTADDIFTFLVTLETGIYDVSGAVDAADNESQRFVSGTPRKFRIQGEGNSLQIAGVPIDSSYTVVEVIEETVGDNTVKVMPTGYDFTRVEIETDNNAATNSDSITQSGKLAEVNVLTYVNTYTTGSLTINKEITGADSNTGDDEFKVNVTLPKGEYGVTIYTVAEDGVTLNGTTANGEFVNGNADTVTKQYTITGAGKIIITGIPKDSAYNVVEVLEEVVDEKTVRVLPAGYELSGYTYKGTQGKVEAGNVSTVTITNIYRTGDLKITKEVDNPINFYADDSFEFTVTLPAGIFQYKIFNKNGVQQRPAGYSSNGISNGGKLILRNGWYALIEDIPAGAECDYTVVEKKKDLYTKKATNATGKIVANEIADVKFVNTHLTDDLLITKSVTGANVSSGEKFAISITVVHKDTISGSFDCIFKDSTGKETNDKITFGLNVASYQLGHGESLTILGLPVDARCTVTETMSADQEKYYTCDETSKSVVIVVDDPDTDVVETAKAEFVNKRKSSSLNVKKVVESADGSELTTQKDVDFTFDVRLRVPDDDYFTLNSSYSYTKTGEKETQTLNLTDFTEEDVAWKQGTITLRHDQVATFDTLPAGTEFWIVEKDPKNLGYDIKKQECTDGQTSAGEDQTAIITNKHQNGMLSFNKVVDPNGYEIPKYVDETFIFTVSLKNKTDEPLANKSFTYSVTAGTDAERFEAESGKILVLDEKGVGEIELAAGQKATIVGLAPGTKYEVVEETPVGFRLDYKDDINSGDIEAGKEDSITIINTYDPASLKIVKAIVGDKDANCADDVFTFKVTFSENGVFPVEYNKNDKSTVECDAIDGGYFSVNAGTEYTIKIKGENWISLLRIPLNSSYVVKETGWQPGYDSSKTTYVVDDAAVVTGTEYKGEFYVRAGEDPETNHTDEITFTNTYDTSSLTINKKIVDEEGKDVTDDENINNDPFKVNVTLPVGEYDVTVNGVTGDGDFTSNNKDDTTVTKQYTIQGSKSIVINRVPVGASYTVEEVKGTGDLPTGYSWESYGSNTGTIAENGSTATITNSYAVGKLEISKTVEGKFVANDTFKFEVSGLPVGKYPYTVVVDGSDDDDGSEYELVIADADENAVTGSGTLNLKDGETATITRLPIGANYTVTEKLTVEQAKDYVVTKTGDTGTISETTSEAKFTNTHKVGNLKITKTVGSDVTTSEKFTFTVTVNYNGGLLAVDGTYGDATFDNGVATVELEHGESAEIVGLPAEATYTVVETANNRYTTTKTDDSGSIVADETATAAFTNVHTLGDLQITKTVVPVDGYKLTNEQKNKEFDFTVTLEPQNGAVLNSDYTCVMDGTEKIQKLNAVENSTAKTFTVKLKHGEVYRIKNLPIGTKYSVVETVDSNYAKSATNDKGAIVAENTETPEVETATAAFTNTHKPGKLKVTKEVSILEDVMATADGDTEIPEELTRVFTFTVTLTPSQTPENYFTLPSTVSYTKTDASGIVKNGTLDLEGVAGTQLNEKKCVFTLMTGESMVLNGLRPDTQYSISEAVVDGYVRTRVITDAKNTHYVIDADNTDTVAYTNLYNPNTLVIEKKIVDKYGNVVTTGNVTNDVFTFEVTLPKGHYTLTDQNNNPHSLESTDTDNTHVVTITGPGRVNISGIPIGYDYTVKETGTPNGYTFNSVDPYMYNYNDTNRVWVEVKDERVIVDRAVEQGVSSEISYRGNRVEFTNTYKTGELEISKQVVGLDAPKGENADSFKFTVNFYIANVVDAEEGAEPVEKELQEGTFTCTVKDENGKVVSSAPTQIKNGTATLNLKHGWTALISDIPTGTYYEVMETVPDDYGMKSTGATGNISPTKSEAKFINSYEFGSLTVKKTFSTGVTPEDGETFLFKVKQGNTLIAEIVMSGKDIKAGKNSVTLSPLPVGDYTVEEDTAWSWRYKLADGYSASLKQTVSVTNNPVYEFKNTTKTDKWLDSNAYADNLFSTPQ